MKIYTRTGDGGQTQLFGGRTVAKSHPRVEAYGAVDELNAALGMAASTEDSALRSRLRAIQARLFDVGADLATPPEGRSGDHVQRLGDAWAEGLEADIDRLAEELPPLDTFILPGGTLDAARLHQARTVCRRAERKVVAAAEAGEEINGAVVRYLNRLGDWLFVAARVANADAGVADVPWRPEDRSSARERHGDDG